MSNSIIQWFVGFSEAEGCFKIKPKYRSGKSTVHSFNFEFEIHLHIDDIKLLKYISDSLSIGKVYERVNSNSCSFVVGNEKELRALIALFEGFSFNGIKLLDYLDFKEAFFLYFDRPGLLDKDLISKILKLKEGMNKGRVNFNMPIGHQINITKYWLLGLIEGEGSFSFSREKLRPNFQLLFTAAQKPLLEEIKRYLISNLGLDRFSLWKINNSSIIGIYEFKSKGNSKPTVSLEIRDLRVLHNYIIPFLSSMSFISKKGLDFADFILICQLLYVGAHKDSKIKELILRLSLGMNDFRLSTYKGDSSRLNKALFTDEFTLLKEVVAISSQNNQLRSQELSLVDEDFSSDQDPGTWNINSVVYLIIRPDKAELLVASLKEAAGIVGVHYSTLSKLLASLSTPSKGVDINNNIVIKVKVFTGN
jgi:hypothetical protein